MVEEFRSSRGSLADARQLVDDLLESPEAALRREDKAAQAALSGSRIHVPGAPRR